MQKSHLGKMPAHKEAALSSTN